MQAESGDQDTQSPLIRRSKLLRIVPILFSKRPTIVIASASEAIQGNRKDWIASAFAKKLRRTGRRKPSSQ
ncbi:hypothetical protein [Bradyrhizobium canariense]|uniref:hypothetical protein n=1 Tax=Bradyrhizobium canariense TaxID=255045 RepID=UPI0011BA66D7|nr:hypothetical protein [Bradyrhizobium canariense]